MLGKLNLDEREDDMSVISSVAKELFSDGITNWGRIASLLAFGAVVCLYEKESGRGHCVSFVAEEISSYLLCNQKEWLLKNNSWVSWHLKIVLVTQKCSFKGTSFLVVLLKAWVFLYTHSLCWNVTLLSGTVV